MLLRELIGLELQGGDVFFGEPEFDSADLLRVSDDGRGMLSILGLREVQDRPKLVFFFDEAHLLFNDASAAFLDAMAQTVRLIRSKGVGVFFVTQTPTDVPDEVLAQLGNRVQHALRAFTPNDAKALRATVGTFPRSDTYDLEELLTSLGIGEAVVTILSETARRPRSAYAPLPRSTLRRCTTGRPATGRPAT